MPFWSDALRVVGAVAAPVLAATGVGIPLAVGIGAVAAGAGNFGADAIDRTAEQNRANEEAARQKAAADARIAQSKKEEQDRAAEVARDLERRQAHAALPSRLMDACSAGRVQEIPGLLQQMDNDQINALGFTPVAQCTDANVRSAVLQHIQAERARRGIA